MGTLTFYFESRTEQNIWKQYFEKSTGSYNIKDFYQFRDIEEIKHKKSIKNKNDNAV